ncbi:MAG: hypothetical protein KKI08_12330, partial [Armatimonadetes bacterium]|nr:hypothetical protein [Armatimonadota bacterium]
MARLICLATLLLLSGAALSHAAPASCYDWILRDKIRGGYLSSADLGDGQARMKSVGMNLLMPKFGGLQAPPTEGNIALLRRWGESAQATGLHLMPVYNFRGGATEALLSDRREVTIAGSTMPKTPCPLDEAFWSKYIIGRAVWLAEHSRELHLDGCIIDPEMYGADHTCFAGACYCADCFKEFLATLPNGGPAEARPLQAAERAPWLKEHGLLEQFQQHFVDRIIGFSQRLERECHAQNPDFLLGVLLLDYPLPAHRAMAMGLGTATHPVLGFSESTYSPGYTDYVDQQQETFAAMPAHVLFVPGLWQQQFPSENLAEQYTTCAAHSAGYWIYTFESLLEDVSKLPGYQLREPHEKYWEACRVANAELDKLAKDPQYVSALKIRPYDPPLPVLNVGDITIEALVPAPNGGPADSRPLLGPITTPRLRYRNPLFILGKAGEAVTVKVTNLQLANYRPGTHWAVVGPDRKLIAEGQLKVKETRDATFTPDRDGVYLLVAQSGQNSHSLVITTGQRYAFIASEKHKLTVNGQFGRMYF